MKGTKNYVRTSTPTLTQSGLLAVLLQRQRHKAIELAQRRTVPEHRRSLIQNCWRMRQMAELFAHCGISI